MEPQQNQVILEEMEEGQLVFCGGDDPLEQAAALVLLTLAIVLLIPLALLTAAVVGIVAFSNVLSL